MPIVFGPTQFTTQGDINILTSPRAGVTVISQVKLNDERRKALESQCKQWIDDDFVADELAKVQKRQEEKAVKALAAPPNDGHTPSASASTPLMKEGTGTGESPHAPP